MEIFDSIAYALSIPTNEFLFKESIRKNLIPKNVDFLLINTLEEIIDDFINQYENMAEIEYDKFIELYNDFKIHERDYEKLLIFFSCNQVHMHKEHLIKYLNDLALLIFLREIAIFLVSFRDGEFIDLAILFNQMAIANISFLFFSNDNDHENLKILISEMNSKNARSRWESHNRIRPEKKKQYLQIMREQGFTTYAQTATYIKQEIETGNKPSYDTICRWLSQAGKGNFT